MGRGLFHWGSIVALVKLSADDQELKSPPFFHNTPEYWTEYFSSTTDYNNNKKERIPQFLDR